MRKLRKTGKLQAKAMWQVASELFNDDYWLIDWLLYWQCKRNETNFPGTLLWDNCKIYAQLICLGENIIISTGLYLIALWLHKKGY